MTFTYSLPIFITEVLPLVTYVCITVLTALTVKVTAYTVLAYSYYVGFYDTLCF